MTGMLNGSLIINGIGKNINVITGDLTSSTDGGNVTITDTGFLENMARNSKLPTNVVVDSFKDYHYNVGLVKMFLDHGDLNMNVDLDGARGKRNLKVDLHDFNLE